MLRKFLNELTKRFRATPASRTARRAARTFRPRLEILEEREVPAITLSAMTTFAVGTTPYGVTTADLNGDGRLDLIQANNSGSTISVLLNTTVALATTPTFSAQQTFAVGAGAYFVATGDVNGDGKDDLAVTNATAGTVSVLLNTTAVGAAAATFSAQQTFTVGTNPDAVALADVNSDGTVDIVTANTGSGRISVLLNTTAAGATTSSFAAQQTFTVGSNPDGNVAVGDVNGDGRVDLAVANYSSNTVSVLLNTTAPGATSATFAAQTTFAVGSNAAHAVLTDLNGDGRVDLAVANYAGGPGTTISVLLNTTTAGAATPTFSAQQTITVGSGPWGIAVGDYDGDGRNDLAVGNSFGSGTVSVLLNTTANGAAVPSFASQQTFTAGSAPYYVTAADFNNDGRTDIAVANSGVADSLGVFLNTTVFAGQVTFGTGINPNDVAVADFNSDGRPDLVSGNFGSAGVSVLLNTTTSAGPPRYSAQQTFSSGAGTTPFGIAVGDINGDGRPDIVVANNNTITVSVLVNMTPVGAAAASFAPHQIYDVGPNAAGIGLADFNGDGKLDVVTGNSGSNNVSVLLNNTLIGASIPVFAAQQTFTLGNGPQSIAIADVNGDGRPDIATANNNSGNVTLLLNTTAAGATTFSFAAATNHSTGTNPKFVAFGDFNGDGRPDLATSNY